MARRRASCSSVGGASGKDSTIAAQNSEAVKGLPEPRGRLRALAADVIAGVGWAALIVVILLFSLSHSARFIYAGF
jgi:hypothetical protein